MTKTWTCGVCGITSQRVEGYRKLCSPHVMAVPRVYFSTINIYIAEKLLKSLYFVRILLKSLLCLGQNKRTYVRM